MNFFSSHRSRRTLGIGTAAVAAVVAFAGTASAQQPELAVNALAAEIATQADLAVEAHDEYIKSEGLVDYVMYAKHRIATARLAARQLGYDEFLMIDAWSDASLNHQRAVLAAMTQIGVPYRSLASVEDEGFDCSGLTLYAWQASGVELNRISGDQIRAATRVDRDEASAGDLVHYPGHVMMYLGVGDAVVHSVSTGRTVEIDTISKTRASRVTFGNPID
jgi:cell wall-associated NlpC family hydrolase